jgi:hypothetical protein
MQAQVNQLRAEVAALKQELGLWDPANEVLLSTLIAEVRQLVDAATTISQDGRRPPLPEQLEAEGGQISAQRAVGDAVAAVEPTRVDMLARLPDEMIMHILGFLSSHQDEPRDILEPITYRDSFPSGKGSDACYMILDCIYGTLDLLGPVSLVSRRLHKITNRSELWSRPLEWLSGQYMYPWQGPDDEPYELLRGYELASWVDPRQLSSWQGRSTSSRFQTLFSHLMRYKARMHEAEDLYDDINVM